jgi:hypothetical protein
VTVPAEPGPAPGGAPGPAEPDRAPGRDVPAAPRPRRRGPRRATGGTFTDGTSTGAEPRLPGLDGRASAADADRADEASDRAHEDWLRAQRPPHWD